MRTILIRRNEKTTLEKKGSSFALILFWVEFIKLRGRIVPASKKARLGCRELSHSDNLKLEGILLDSSLNSASSLILLEY